MRDGKSTVPRWMEWVNSLSPAKVAGRAHDELREWGMWRVLAWMVYTVVFTGVNALNMLLNLLLPLGLAGYETVAAIAPRWTERQKQKLIS